MFSIQLRCYFLVAISFVNELSNIRNSRTQAAIGDAQLGRVAPIVQQVLHLPHSTYSCLPAAGTTVSHDRVEANAGEPSPTNWVMHSTTYSACLSVNSGWIGSASVSFAARSLSGNDPGLLPR